MKSPDELLKLLVPLVPELKRRFHVHSIGLFGSILRKDFAETSDIDIIVDFDQIIGIEFIDLADYLESVLHVRVDLVSRKGIKEKYLQIIEPHIMYV